MNFNESGRKLKKTVYKLGVGTMPFISTLVVIEVPIVNIYHNLRRIKVLPTYVEYVNSAVTSVFVQKSDIL